MKALELLEATSTPNGRLTLHERDGDYFIRLDGQDLMSSRLHGSEQALARLAIARLEGSGPIEVLVGGLGMGFTLRAALDAVADRPGSRVTVAEVFAPVVRWNEKYFGELNGYPLEDARTRIRTEDVRASLGVAPGEWRAILLDVDNGPVAFTLESNRALYDAAGLQVLFAAIAPGGVLATWSAAEEPAFLQRMKEAGFSASAETVPAGRGRKGGRHTIYLGRRS